MPENTLAQPLDAADLLQLGYVDDVLLMEDTSLCSQCSYTCTHTGVINPEVS